MSMRVALAFAVTTSSAWAQAPKPSPAAPKPSPAAPKPSPAAPDPSDGDFVEVTAEDVFAVDAGRSHVVLLKSREDGRVLPIWIGEAEAVAISLRLARKKPPRPLTHDLIERVLSATGASVTRVHIEDLRDSTFLGRIFLKAGTRVVDLDARPSDSIAIALGARAPIYAARKVLDKAGIDAKAFGEGNPEPDLEDLLKKGKTPGRGQSI